MSIGMVCRRNLIAIPRRFGNGDKRIELFTKKYRLVTGFAVHARGFVIAGRAQVAIFRQHVFPFIHSPQPLSCTPDTGTQKITRQTISNKHPLSEISNRYSNLDRGAVKSGFSLKNQEKLRKKESENRLAE
ncbi:MAG: hypothetical protein C4527_03295 [Candidatus Omnitrophota bacterium]|nr:MAG: hypothetical protein C4527_03295 [Candidatus Omnitrophota bacterium]